MQHTHVAALLNFAATLDSRVRRVMASPEQSAATIRAWSQALDGIPAASEAADWDAARAVRRYYEQRNGDRSAQFRAIEPHDLLAAWAPYRAELMNRHTDPAPPVDPDNVDAYLAELRTSRTAVATGQAAPIERPQLTGGPHPAVEARLAAIGSPIPPAVRRQLAAYRPTKARREATVAAGQPDPLSVPCPWCHAEEEQPCRGGWRPNGKGRRTKTTPHDSRAELAANPQGVAA
ncbi:zinc finger domain-containing protein [Streptomyces noursei]|uniref:DNA-binding phage zinc finger domain-containing protein n=1 Tax=Streptomyces noursei TaxID=1971 RepID=A0A2N8PNY1_STRNR|nr:hypothetical protein [Streptomyces noursei]PNE42733.1 hypothetical protein AOB60_20240 [Streptomyces noursei]